MTIKGCIEEGHFVFLHSGCVLYTQITLAHVLLYEWHVLET